MPQKHKNIVITITIPQSEYSNWGTLTEDLLPDLGKDVINAIEKIGVNDFNVLVELLPTTK